tara:strand:- start:290 stop:646 length:357 start_codon:yes stop_codon:yes gene_type:complete
MADTRVLLSRSVKQNERYSKIESFFNELSISLSANKHDEHGDFKKTHEKIAEIWNLVLKEKLSQPLKASDVSTLMMALKLARMIMPGINDDNYTDIAGYAAITKILKREEQSNDTTTE